jgi:hypothetical protein
MRKVAFLVANDTFPEDPSIPSLLFPRRLTISISHSRLIAATSSAAKGCRLRLMENLL